MNATGEEGEIACLRVHVRSPGRHESGAAIWRRRQGKKRGNATGDATVSGTFSGGCRVLSWGIRRMTGGERPLVQS